MSRPPPLPQAAPQRPRAADLWNRHWKWAVPGIGIALSVLLALLIGGVLYVITAALKSSDVYRDALQIAKTDAQVVQRLGMPINEDVLINGSIRYSGPTGEAHFSVGLHGPRGKGRVQVDAMRRQGRWTYRTLTFASVDGARIDVLPVAASPPPPRRP
ncbi:cytochrome c oxidase assembly factor Coa1 family protein [Xanthomonas euvesicatoria]|uniref:cytochrome c oxidase assembly factor Coa1 family protein n=2 Tax=Xanthomonas euvesicatoria TaxID=456327 RepID=UPI001E4A833C|nr:cytochrome c oxidase assembly factor Coa1 family protein [Xanthomonas euvesicatoria]